MDDLPLWIDACLLYRLVGFNSLSMYSPQFNPRVSAVFPPPSLLTQNKYMQPFKNTHTKSQKSHLLHGFDHLVPLPHIKPLATLPPQQPRLHAPLEALGDEEAGFIGVLLLPVLQDVQHGV